MVAALYRGVFSLGKSGMTAVGEDYAAAGFGGTLQPGRKPVLLLIDFARAYFDSGSPLYAGVEAVRIVAADLRKAAT